jgi:hypothetical protein
MLHPISEPGLGNGLVIVDWNREWVRAKVAPFWGDRKARFRSAYSRLSKRLRSHSLRRYRSLQGMTGMFDRARDIPLADRGSLNGTRVAEFYPP